MFLIVFPSPPPPPPANLLFSLRRLLIVGAMWGRYRVDIMIGVYTLMFVYCFIDFQDGVNDLDVGVNQSIFFALNVD